jgi:uncharacterized protein (DUF305 family)
MRRFAIMAAALAAALTLAGCGSQSSSTTDNNGAGSTPANSAAAGEHNSADVTFAQMMIPHHEQAIEMATLAEVRAGSPQVKELASQIQAAQDPEIDTMTGWLTDWGEPTTAAGVVHGGGHDGGGMMSSEDMTKLQGLTGKAFDREFLTMMTAHHQGAIEMARTEQADGRYEPAKTMAADIVRTQSEEIVKMAELQKSIQ